MLSSVLAGPMNGFTYGPRVSSVSAQGGSYQRISVSPVAPSIGAVVEGVSLADPLDAQLREELNRALLEWKVLFFKAQSITHEEQQAFASNWGSLEVHPFFVKTTAPEGASPQVVRLEKDAKQPGFENIWHSDVTWRSEPSLGSVLRAVEVPDVGGDTLWCDMAAAYDNLTDAMKNRIENLSAVNDWFYSFGELMEPGQRDALRSSFPAVEHPIVRVHPETGRRILYVNRIFTQHVVGMDQDESAELLDFLYLQANVPEFQCRHRWEPGDVAFWDNRSTQHYASSDYFPNRRVMERITVVGDRPLGVLD